MACTNTPDFKDELVTTSLNYSEPSISYLSLAFSNKKDHELALQAALVKYKEEAIFQERWLLLHGIPYQWIVVDLHGKQWSLLAVGPFKTYKEMASKRVFLQEGLGQHVPMPAIALNFDR